MKSSDIFMCLGEIDEKLIEEAAPKKFRLFHYHPIEGCA